MFPVGMSEQQFAAMYTRQHDALAQLAILQFRIPCDAAELLAAEVLLASLRHAFSETQWQAWLPAAMSSAARHWAASHH